MQDAFTARQASALTGCTAHQLRYWDRVDLVTPSIQTTGGRAGVRRLYSFRDLVWLRVVKGLLDNGMSVQRVRRAADYLRRNADLDDTLAGVRLVTDGQSIFQVLEEGDHLLDALKEGQLAFVLVIDEITQTVEDDVSRFELDKAQFLSIVRASTDELSSELTG
ncbi:MAG: helix-turn-helix domain-containing protein [Acidimicrobiia bacterium]